MYSIYTIVKHLHSLSLIPILTLHVGTVIYINNQDKDSEKLNNLVKITQLTTQQRWDLICILLSTKSKHLYEYKV